MALVVGTADNVAAAAAARQQLLPVGYTFVTDGWQQVT
jgi:hypothetical protein